MSPHDQPASAPDHALAGQDILQAMPTTHHTPATCLATVKQSPQAVAAHDKAAWLAIFARYNIVEDPVGSPPHVSGLYDRRSGVRGNAPLARFHDCFIAPLEIMFHVEHDFVRALSVVRDLTIELRMSPHVTLHVPMHLRYELIEEQGTLKVHHLAAHWELWPMLKQLMSFGLASLGPGLSLGRRMLSLLGVTGTLGFMRALDSVGQRGKERLAALVEACNQRAPDNLRQQLSSDFIGISWHAAAPPGGIESLIGLPGQIKLGKTLAAGDYISASFTLQHPQHATADHGVMFCEFNRHERKIQRLQIYMNPSATATTNTPPQPA